MWATHGGRASSSTTLGEAELGRKGASGAGGAVRRPGGSRVGGAAGVIAAVMSAWQPVGWQALAV